MFNFIEFVQVDEPLWVGYSENMPWLVEAFNDMEPLKLFKVYKTDMKVAVGVIDVKNEEIETPELVATRIRRALEVIPKGKIWITTDCGMKFMPRDRAFGKLKALVNGTKIVREEIGV